MSPPPDLPTASDQDVVTAILEGNAKAYRELYGRYVDRVYAFTYQLVLEPDVAQDLTQETFVKAFEKLTSYRPELPFAPWIIKIANNKVLDYLRKKQSETRAVQGWLDETTGGKRLREGVPAIDKTPSDPSRGYSLARFQALLQAITQLKEPYRRFYILRDIEKRSYDDIAKALHVPAGTVRSYVHRARKQLREMLAALLEISPTPA